MVEFTGIDSTHDMPPPQGRVWPLLCVEPVRVTVGAEERRQHGNN